MTFRPLVLAAALALAGCGGDDAKPKGTDPVVVAAAWPWKAHGDLLYGQGMDMAVDEIRASGGVAGRPVELRRVDDNESVDEGRMLAQRLAKAPEVAAVIGHLQSYVTVPAAAVYDAGGKVLVAPSSTDAELTAHGYPRVFRMIFSDRQTGRAMADVVQASHRSRVGIYYVRSAYGRALANAFEERGQRIGLTVVDRQAYDPSTREDVALMGEIARDWKGRDVDAVFIAGEAPQAARFAREMHREGLDVPLFGGDALGTPELVAVGGADVEGMVLPAPFHPDEPREEVKRFSSEFRRRYGRTPDALAALGYDAVNVVAQAVKQARSTDAARVASGLRSLGGWRGVTGAFAFDSVGDLPGRSIVIVVVKEGKFAYLQNVSPAPAHVAVGRD